MNTPVFDRTRSAHQVVFTGMEHRWGMRRGTRLAVSITSQVGIEAAGWLRDLSISGAFVHTRLRLPIMSTVRVLAADDVHRSVPQRPLWAYVVRRDAQGVGLEWSEFAPDSFDSIRLS